MGYVHDAGFCYFTPPTLAYGTVATWAVGAGQVSNSIVYACDATDETAHLFIPLLMPSHTPDANGNAVKGFLLTSIEIDYEIRAAACDAVSVVINKNKRGATGADVTISNPAFTYDTGHDAASERLTLDEHKMVLTLDTPAYVEDDEYYWLDFTIDKAATSIFELLGTFAKGTLRA